MIPDAQVAPIRPLFHAEHGKIGPIAAELLLHPDTVRRALDTDRFRSQPPLREALGQQTPRLSSVAFILARRHRQRRQRPPLTVHLARRPDLENLTVSNPSQEAYHDLTQDPEEDPDAEP
jgi:hypothetical protein